MTITIENAKDLYRTENTFTEKGNTITKEEKEYIKETFNEYKMDGYDENDILYFIACDFDTYVAVIKKIIEKD